MYQDFRILLSQCYAQMKISFPGLIFAQYKSINIIKYYYGRCASGELYMRVMYHIFLNSGAARGASQLRSKVWLSIHPRNFGRHITVHLSTPQGKQCEISHFLANICIAHPSTSMLWSIGSCQNSITRPKGSDNFLRLSAQQSAVTL